MLWIFPSADSTPPPPVNFRAVSSTPLQMLRASPQNIGQLIMQSFPTGEGRVGGKQHSSEGKSIFLLDTESRNSAMSKIFYLSMYKRFKLNFHLFYKWEILNLKRKKQINSQDITILTYKFTSGLLYVSIKKSYYLPPVPFQQIFSPSRET